MIVPRAFIWHSIFVINLLLQSLCKVTEHFRKAHPLLQSHSKASKCSKHQALATPEQLPRNQALQKHCTCRLSATPKPFSASETLFPVAPKRQFGNKIPKQLHFVALCFASLYRVCICSMYMYIYICIYIIHMHVYI